MALNPDGMSYFLGMLFGKEVTIKQGPALTISQNDNASVCTYRDGRGRVVAGCLFDFPMAAYSSAALSMIPAGAAQDAIDEKSIPDSLKENLHEVFNVAVGFFGNGKVGPNLRLHEMKVYPPDDSKELVSTVSSISARKDYTVDIEDYGTGNMILFLL